MAMDNVNFLNMVKSFARMGESLSYLVIKPGRPIKFMLFGVCWALLSLAGCGAPTPPSSPIPTEDWLAMHALETFAAALTEQSQTPTATTTKSETLTPTATASETATATMTPNAAATEAFLATRVAIAIAATQTAMATDTFTPRPTATATPIPTRTPTPTEPRCSVISASLNLRSGPGVNYPVIGSLISGAELAPRSRNQAATWVEIRVLANGQNGWVSAGAEYVRCTVAIAALPLGIIPPPPVAPATNTPIPAPPTSTSIPVQPTNPPPTPAPTPANPATIVFYADQTILPGGGCTVLHWHVENVQELYIDGNETTGHIDQPVCPVATQTFTLRILHRDGHWEERTVTIEMTPPEN